VVDPDDVPVTQERSGNTIGNRRLYYRGDQRELRRAK